MFYVATLLCNPAAPALTLTDDMARKAARLLPFGRLGQRLGPGSAIDITFQAPDLDDPSLGPSGEQDFVADLAGKLRGLFGSAPIDVVIQPDNSRRKRLLLADMDSTMIEQECIDELADFVGLKAEVAAITERAMNGAVAFEPALRERVALLKGLPVAAVDEIVRERIRLTSGARTLVATLRANGVHTCLVSGGFTLFTGPIAAAIGFDEHRSNRLILDGETLAGAVGEPILGREAKRSALIELRDRLGLEAADTLAVGDGANDLSMLEAAGLGVAFRAKPAVAAKAHARIDHSDLTALLYVQGYRRDEFVEPGPR